MKMTLYENLTIITLALSAVIFLVQAGIAVKSLTADHTRRKREATIHYINQIRPQYREMNNELIQKLGEGAVDDTKINAILENKELHSKVKDMLGLFEHLAVGVNANVFDLKLLNLMSGNYLITINNRYMQYFERRRREANNPRLYEEFGKLVTNLKQLRGE
jgi:hypothetical protein